MIGSLRGTLLDRSAGEVLVEVGGVGYRVTVTPATVVTLGDIGDEVFLHVHHHVREDAQTLFGFPSRDERACFEALIGAHGVGPTLALAILSVHEPEALRRVLADDDIASLCLVPGVGRKTAARLLVELKSRLAVPDLDLGATGLVLSGRDGVRSVRADVREALAGLGYGPEEVRDVLHEVPDDGDASLVLREALQRLALGAAVGSAHAVREELLTPEPDPAELADEIGLRPARLDEFVGQAELKEHLAIILEAARRRGQAADHLLLAGPPGLGKTSLAGIVANEMGARLHTTSGPAIERAGDLAAILTSLDEGDVLFIDEIHRLARAVEEVLYPAMEDFQLDIVLGKGPAARSIRLDLPRFTLVGATTRTGLITGPLRDRFGLNARLDYYDPVELEAILLRSARILGVRIDRPGANEIARRARGTPRIANRLLRRVRDYAEVRGDGTVDESTAHEGLAVFGVDDLGLDKVDRAVLQAICGRFGGGPVGLKTLAISVGEPEETVEDVYEPFLIQLGLIMRTHRGRVATPAAWAHVGLAPPPTAETPGLF